MTHYRRVLSALLAATFFTACATLLTACATVNVNTDYALEQDFSGYRHYAWHPDGVQKTTSLDTMGGDIFDNRVRLAIEHALSQRGMVKAEAADFYVNYSVVTESRMSVNTYNTYGGYGPGWGYAPYGGWGHGSTHTSVYYYTQGTLIIDVIDATTNKLAWRSTADGRVDQSSTPEKKEQALRKTITKMLEKFPPIQP